MKRLALALCLLAILAIAPAPAQVVTTAPFPQGGQPNNLTASNTGTTGSITATLTGAAGRWTYLCGFTITSGGTSAANVQAPTITGTVSGTLSFTYVFVSSGQGVLGVAFPGCISSSAQNTSIVLTVPAGGAGTTVAANMWGYTN